MRVTPTAEPPIAARKLSSPSKGLGVALPGPGTPVRTCVGCRQRDRPSELVRIAVRAGVAVVDRRAPGRGAWMHPPRPDSPCWEAKGLVPALGRALRSPQAAIDLGDLRRSAEEVG